MPTHHPLGQRLPVLREAFTSCLSAFGGPLTCHQLPPPNDNGGVERVKHTMAQMLAMVVSGRQDEWDWQLPHVRKQ